MASDGISLILARSEDIHKQLTDFNLRLESAMKEQKQVKPTLEDIYQEFSIFKTDTLQFINSLKVLLLQNSNQIDNLDNYSRRNCLVFHGVPEVANENVEQAVVNIISTLKIPNWTPEISIIDRCHRLGKHNTVSNNTRPIIVKFTTYNARKNIWNHKKILKGTKILLTESLSQKRLALFKEARTVFGVANVWSMDCRIFIKLHDGKIRRIEHKEEFDKLKESSVQVDRINTRSNSKKQKGG